MSLIEFKNVTKSFGKKQVLKGINLSVNEGETLAIVGGSGSGKSVTLKLLLRLLEADDGEILFKGRNILDMNDEEILGMRSQIGMLFQGGALFDSLTVFENIAYPIEEHYDYPPEKIETIVMEKLRLVGMEASRDLYPSDLSGGMKKRISLSRAIATDPDVILYDEPTSGLDPSNTNRVDDLIIKTQKVLKVTSVVVTHNMPSVFRVADRLALIYQGKVEFVGSVADVERTNNEIVKNFINGRIGDL